MWLSNASFFSRCLQSCCFTSCKLKWFFCFWSWINFCNRCLNSHSPSSNMQTLITTSNHESVRHCLIDQKLQKVYDNILEHGTGYYRYLVFPMNSTGNRKVTKGVTPYHWTLLLYDMEEQIWKHYNSLSRKNSAYLLDATQVVQKKHTFSPKISDNPYANIANKINICSLNTENICGRFHKDQLQCKAKIPAIIFTDCLWSTQIWCSNHIG